MLVRHSARKSIQSACQIMQYLRFSSSPLEWPPPPPMHKENLHIVTDVAYLSFLSLNGLELSDEELYGVSWTLLHYLGHQILCFKQDIHAHL